MSGSFRALATFQQRLLRPDGLFAVGDLKHPFFQALLIARFCQPFPDVSRFLVRAIPRKNFAGGGFTLVPINGLLEVEPKQQEAMDSFGVATHEEKEKRRSGPAWFPVSGVHPFGQRSEEGIAQSGVFGEKPFQPALDAVAQTLRL